MLRHRYAVLDSYRFFAAIGVVLYHFEGHLSLFRPQPSNVLDRFQTLVDFFFVLSGFVLMHTYGTRIHSSRAYREFLRRRFARIYPLHLATVLLCAAIAAVVWARNIPIRDPSLIDMRQLGQNLLLVQAWGTTERPGLNFPSWSISAEVFVYLLFPIFAFLVLRLRPWMALAIALTVAGATEAIRAHLGMRPAYIATFDFGAIRAVPTFLAGMAVYRIVNSLPERPFSWFWPNALVAAIVALMFVKAPFPLIVAFYPLLVGLIAVAERGGRTTIFAAPTFMILGNASFAIYMIHSFIQIGCVSVVRTMGWTSIPALILVAAIGTLVIVTCAILSFRLFETPMRFWLGRPQSRKGTTYPRLRPEGSQP